MFYEVSSAHATRNEVMKMTLTVELDENLVRELEARAQRLHISPQQLAIQILCASLETQSPNGESGARAELDEATFGALARGVVRDYREVLERLA
jgi:predicted transcriptional regulator